MTVDMFESAHVSRLRLAAAASLATAAWLSVVAGSATARADQPAAPALPDLIRTTNRSFTIPFRLPKSQDPDATAAPQKVLLQVSRDLGTSWQAAGDTTPATGSFTYRTEDDGEYWFRLRAVDGKGRTRGGEGPDMRVLVDAAGPRVAARVWKGSDGEIVCRYAASDATLRTESLAVEYRSAGDPAWKKVAAQGILARESPAHLVGEEIWWAGEKVDSLAVRITVADAAGNRTVEQFALESSDPGVDQAALAQELGVLPLPARSEVTTATAASETLPSRPAGQPGTWTAEQAGAWTDGEPLASNAATGRGRSVVVRRAATSDAAALLPKADDARLDERLASAARAPLAPAAADVVASAGGGPLQYRGKPLHLTRARTFLWEYELDADGTAPRVALWSTRDGGTTWQRTAVDDDGRSPIEVRLAASGMYGFRLETGPDALATGPRSGEEPDSWVGVDDEAPQVEILEVTREESAAAVATVVIRYQATDTLLIPGTTRLLYSPHADGPWATIVEGVDGTGEYRWTPDRTVPARVFVRIECRDAAGNMGHASSREPVMLSAPRPVGRLGGLRAAP